MRGLLYFLYVSLALLAASARADDIAATGRGVVRVVTIATVDGKVVGFGHGSGVAVAPNRIVTNAHVVELNARFPDNVIVGVVPSEGAKSFSGRVVAYDPARDLALVEFTGAKLPVAALYTGPVSEGDAVVSLGYPGNVDLATAQSADDYIKPLVPVRSEGVFSSRRTLSGVDVLLHSSAIARGNSGGPLLDRCGRVLGINSALTRGDDGDATFGFAIADTEVLAFLREAKQAAPVSAAPCTSIEERLSRDAAADIRAKDQAEASARDAANRAEQQRAAALEQARVAAEHTRENVMALAALMLVAGALALGGAGLLESRGKRREAIWAASGGGVLIVAAVATFLLRPEGDPKVLEPSAVATPSAARKGAFICTIDADRSRVTVSATDDVRIDWQGDGCVNGRTQYAEDGDRWERILVPAEEQTVSVLAYDPKSQVYSNTRYLLSATQMEAARKLRAGVKLKACAPEGPDRASLATQQAAIRDALPSLPNEKLVYTCKPAL